MQCLKRLYLEHYARELADPISDSQQAIFDVGTEVGNVARKRFPGGVFIRDPYYEHYRAVRATRRLLANESGRPLYEAAFTFEGINCRIDILLPSGDNAFDLIEVKSTTKVKTQHISDVGIQLYVLEELGLQVSSVYLMHINNQYVYPGGVYDLEELFALGDVTAEARRFVSESVPSDLSRMWKTLKRESPPDIEVGRHCHVPYQCPFFGYCHQKEALLPNAVSGKGVVGPDLRVQLAGIRYPTGFLDFETFMPTLPVYPGTRPYQTIPFQWSLHIQEADGRLTHEEFLAEDAGDPRERFIVTLLDAVPPRASIVVYSPYEQRILNELARDFPEYERQLMSLRNRLFDLLPIIRGSYSHPGLPNNSLKSVASVLVPGQGYSNLDIQDGSAASAAYAKMILKDTPEQERITIRKSLLAYCRMDTEVLVSVLKTLRRLA